MTCYLEKKQSLRKDPDITRITELANTDFKAITNVVTD